ncbi:MAG: phosphotriesterase-related protein [Deltaproteobacteria bacterium]|nr:phosphotriesterase-related protein [Deltaproteobacteria bacterium]
MSLINSVLGPLETKDLGFTLMHEHVISQGFVAQNYPELFDDHFMDKIISGISDAKKGGVDTIIDATTFDLGRDAAALAEISRKTKVNIIACTGWWMNMPQFIDGTSPDVYADLFVREIQEGIAGTGIKAGILKSAADFGGVMPEGEIMLRAVARAHIRAMVPIILHSYAPEQVARHQLSILKEEGVDLKWVAVDHVNDTTDLEYLIWLLDQGCYLGMDRYPGLNLSSRSRTETMKKLIDAGWTDRLLPSHDCSLATPDTFFPPEVKESILKGNPYGYLYLKKVVFTQLEEMGVPKAILDTLCVKGPRNFFEGA